MNNIGAWPSGPGASEAISFAHVVEESAHQIFAATNAESPPEQSDPNRKVLDRS